MGHKTRILAAILSFAVLSALAGCGNRNGLDGGTGAGGATGSTGEVDVTVTLNGQPDPGALVQLLDSSHSPVGEQKADQTGTAVFQNVPPASGYTAVASDGGATGQASGISVTAGKTLASVQLSAGGGPAGLITGSVVSVGNETPLSGVQVTCGGQTATTDPNGQFEIAGVPAGSEIVSATLDGYTPTSQTVVVKPGASNAVSLQLQPLASGPKSGHTLITSASGVQELDKWADVVANYSASQAYSAVFEPNGDVLIADGGANKVQLYGTGGNAMTSYTGRSWYDFGLGGVSDPHGASATANNTVLVADTGHNRVVELNGANQVVWSYSTGLNAPQWAERLQGGDTLISDSGNNRVIEVSPSGAIVWGLGGSANVLDHPGTAQRLANGDTLVCDSGNGRVMEVNQQGQLVWGVGNGMQTGSIQLNNPTSARRLATGNTLIADTGDNRVIEVDQSGNVAWQAQVQQPLFADRF